MGLVSVVRPFETADVMPPAVPAKSTPSADQNVVIQCGANPSAKTFSGSFSLDISYYKIRKPKEKVQNA